MVQWFLRRDSKGVKHLFRVAGCRAQGFRVLGFRA